MRKIFSLFAAMLVVLTASATIRNISPTQCFEGTRNDGYTLYVELARGAQAGDTIVMADGEYLEGQSIPVNVPVVIMAAEGAKPVVKMSGYFQVKASINVQGVTFQFVGAEGNGYCFYFYENTPKFLKMKDCEFKDYTQYCVSSWEKYHIDSCIVEDCYFHDLAKAPFYFAPSSLPNDTNACDNLTVKNSTFANITLKDVAVLDLRNNGNNAQATSKLRVDHCTFYNCKGYERMIQSYKSPDASVSNCIMMNPLADAEEASIYATYLYGGDVKNCVWYQTKKVYTKTEGGAVDNLNVDPKFKDAANADYTLADDSPALTAGTDGKAVGDPRWFPKVPAISAVPTEAAPVPTWPADQVKSLYSDTYTFAPASLNSYNEGWWDWPTLTEENIDGNKFLHYNGRMTGMIGWQFGDIAASIMEYIHVDIWPSNDATLKMGPTSPNPTVVAAVELTVQAGKWNSIDIPVADLLAAAPTFNLADIFQNQFTNYSALTDLSIDNVYFYRTTPYVDEAAPTAFTATLDAASYFSATIKAKATDESGAVAFTVKNGETIVGTGAAGSGAEAVITVSGLKAGTKYNLSVIASDDSGNAAEAIAVEVTTTAGPAPATAPKTYKGLVKSFYSDVYPAAVSPIDYMQVWWKGAPISSGELADGENVIFYGVADEGASFGWAFNQIDLTEYPYLHVSVYPLAAGTIEIYPVQQGTADEAPYHRVSETLKANEWNDLVYDFTGLEMTKIQQIGWCNYVTAQGFFVDNVYFSKSKDEVTAADRRINAYGLSVAADGDNYVFSYTANIDGTEANIVFYQNGIEKDAVAIAAPKKGLNQATIAKSDIPKGSNTWAVELKADQVFEFSKVFASDARTGRGQAVINAIPESDFFGYVYYTNRTASTSTSGLYVYNPDYSANGGLNTLGETALWGTQKFSIDATGTLWLPDYTDGGHSGVYVVDPADLTKCTQFFQGERNSSSGLWTNGGVEIGGSSPCAYAYGEGANTKLYVIQEDMTACKNGLTVYNIGQEDGSIAHTWSTAPSKIMPLQDKDGGVFSIGVTDEAIWLCQNRANGSNADDARSLMAYSHDGVRKYVSTDATLIPGSLGGGLVIDKEGLVYIPNAKGSILVLKPTYAADTTVTIEKVGELACGYNMVSSMSFDYAGNLIASVSNSGTYGNNASMLLAVFGMPTENNEVIVPAKKALVVEGTNEVTAIEDNIAPAKVEKVILNGQVLIIRDGKAYNMMGQIVR